MSNLDEFIEDCLREHNARRSRHGAPPLKHSRALDKTAQDWAEELICEETIKNSPISGRGEVGESISMRTSTSSHVDIQGAEVVNQWYADEKNYNYESGKGPAGNFTQLVWSATREVGFGKAKAAGKCIVVAHYRPPGNVRGRYLENVFRPMDGATQRPESEGDTQTQEGAKRSVVTETVTEPDGRRYTVRREVVETTDESGRMKRYTNETYTEASEQQRSNVSSPRSITGHQLMADPASAVDLRQKNLLEFGQSVTDAHNFLRQRHGAPPLTLDQGLCDLAQKWADHLLEQSHLSNSGYTYQGVRVGENIFSRWSNSQIKCDCEDLVNNWYQENTKYKYDQEPGTVQGIGGFTQLVWSGSKNIGVGKAVQSKETASTGTSASTKMVIVCMYYPPGNVKGQFQANVKPPS
ncbi:unnamed protein product [Calicophoron daubneyi]|uniref:Golgi-associated plant pathogenesis-related protein 1 n=1 Tax=Calicophoron daubneyi TaxID=300641 RepID=A0AAV2TL56_CALDB